MHELSIVESLLDQVRAIQTREGATGIGTITVRVGCFSGVDVHALEAAYEVLAPETGFENTRLRAEPVPAAWRCRACGADGETYDAVLVCDRCASPDLELHGGRDLVLQSVELDGEDAR